MVSQTRGSSCTHENSVQPQECFALAVAALDRHLIIPIQGSLTQTTVFRALVGMALMQQSVHAASSIPAESPCETSLQCHPAKQASLLGSPGAGVTKKRKIRPSCIVPACQTCIRISAEQAVPGLEEAFQSCIQDFPHDQNRCRLFVRERDTPVPVVPSGSRLSSAIQYEIVSRQLFLKCECGICSGRNICINIVNFDRNTW